MGEIGACGLEPCRAGWGFFLNDCIAKMPALAAVWQPLRAVSRLYADSTTQGEATPVRWATATPFSP